MAGKIRVGIIGTGKHGSRYAAHIFNDLQKEFTLQAISRRSDIGRSQAAQWQTRYYPDWHELVVSKDVDAVISVTTPNLNPAIAELCVAENKPLLLEKPLTTDYFSARKIVEQFQQNSIPLTIGQTLRFNNVVMALKEKISQMGKLFSFSACQRLEPSTLKWLEKPDVAGAGVIFHTAVHLFDALRFITGFEVEKVRATTANIYNPELEDQLIAEVQFSGGAMGVIDASKVSPSRAGRYEFVCEKGQLQGDQIHGYLQRIEAMEIKDIGLAPSGPTILTLLEQWQKYLNNKGDNPVPGIDGLGAVKICHACRQAASTGDWVSLADF